VRPPAAPERTGPAVSPAPVSPGNGDALSYSRTIRGTTGQILEVPFRGTGWVYLGETNAGPGISYLSRRADSEGQTFIFSLDESGEYELRFYKQDFIRDYILNDHVRVIVESAPERTSFFYPEEPARLVAEPRWPPPENPDGQGAAGPGTAAAGQGGAAPETAAGQDAAAPGTAAGQGSAAVPGSAAGQGAAPGTTAGQGSAAAPGTTGGQGSAVPGRTTPETAAGQGAAAPGTATGQGSAVPGRAAPETAAGQGAGPGTAAVGQGSAAAPGEADESLPEALLSRAREAYEAGHFPEALAALDEFRSKFPLGSDEAWWLYGQLLESSGPWRNIRGALEYYRRLIREYPQSPRCDDARKRIAYLERFYFNIR
jgi:TolA-binding protein